MRRPIQIALTFLAAAASLPAQQRTIRNTTDGLRYVWVEPGKFMMGCTGAAEECFHWESPPRRVEIEQGFWIGETEVTQQAYQRVIGNNPSKYRGPRRPVDQIGWNDATAYCERLGMRLPTEVEWEFAARAGAAESRYGAIEDIAWFDSNARDMTHPVATKQPNAYGLFDVIGNVWEWVQDSYGDTGKRILKGGSFFNLQRDLRVSNRLWAPPDTRHRNIGFRCAQVPP